ncbi:phosphotransferase family protein [Myxococcota bacterium]|nr:phosphotransferase family protein [Myxococcota bacterium]
MSKRPQSMAHMATGTKEVEARHSFDTSSLEAYLQRKLPGFEGPLTVREFRGGQSNPTYELTSPAGQWVLRRKPPGVLLKSAHAVDREYRVISALHATGFPVPHAHLLCQDESVIGTMFFVMEKVDGRLFVDASLPELEMGERRQLYESMIEVLARLHQTDPDSIGLGDYGRPGNYFARQVNRWTKQYRASEGDPVPDMDRLIEWLPENIPADDSASIVHGDYSVNNMLAHPTEPKIVAVLDWELSTIGHPLADVTYQLSQRRSTNSSLMNMSDDELSRQGIPTESEFIELYCAHTGRDGVPDLDFYLAYHFFRSAGIMQGIAGRVRDGTAAGEGATEIGRLVPMLAERGMHYASKLGA